jgi:hypothetical protein
MNIQYELDRLAERYRQQGYRVTVHPGPDDLPPFAKGFRVEILAERPDGNVLVSAKGSRSEFERDPDLAHYADVIEGQPGWRYDVTVLGPLPSAPPPRDVDDASPEQIEATLEVADRLFADGFAPQAALTAWGAFESAMRHRLRAMGQTAGYGTSPRGMLNELISSGDLSHSEFRDLEGLSNLRNIIVHGFAVPAIGQGAIRLLAETARKLLAESKPVEKAS